MKYKNTIKLPDKEPIKMIERPIQDYQAAHIAKLINSKPDFKPSDIEFKYKTIKGRDITLQFEDDSVLCIADKCLYAYSYKYNINDKNSVISPLRPLSLSHNLKFSVK